VDESTLILASSSPRRADILRELGIPFLQVPSNVDETTRRGESEVRYVRRLAEAKALSVAARHPAHWIVGADTTVALGGKLLGKPGDARDAARMLKLLSGRRHRVVSAVALARARDGVLRSGVSVTRVAFRKLTRDEIRWYVETGEPMDKAGAYAIQGKGGLLVSRIEGSFSNVVGFPLEVFVKLAADAALATPWSRRPEAASSRAGAGVRAR
jgi:septum formation protein